MRYTFTWLFHRDESGDNWITRTYDDALISDAASQFYREVVQTPDEWQHVRIEAADTKGPEPERMLMNWERDPMAEVSDGWLSNLAAGHSNLKNELAYRPTFCPDPLFSVKCIQCGRDYAARMHMGQYGYYTRCPECGKTMGRHTKRFTKQTTGIILICGTAHVAMLNSLGCSYEGCPKCNPEGDYERKPIGALVGYTD